MKSLNIFFVPEGKLTVPESRFPVLQGLFYRLLSVEPSRASALHDQMRLQTETMKLFCFGDLHGNGELSWEIRAADGGLIDTIAEGLRNTPCFEIEHCPCRITAIRLGETAFFADRLQFRTETPVTAYIKGPDGQPIFLSPEDPRFFHKLGENLCHKYKSFYGTEPEGEVVISMQPDAVARRCKIPYKSAEIEAYSGRFVLRAPPRLLTLAYHVGIGQRNSLGLGMIDSRSCLPKI